MAKDFHPVFNCPTNFYAFFTRAKPPSYPILIFHNTIYIFSDGIFRKMKKKDKKNLTVKNIQNAFRP